MAPVKSSQSIRSARTTGHLSDASKSGIQRTCSDPLNLRTTNSDDSSVFSGLASEANENENFEDNDENKSVRSVRFSDEEPLGKRSGPRGTSSKIKGDGRKGGSVLGESQSCVSTARSTTSASESQRSALRNLKPVADYDSAFMNSQMGDSGSQTFIAPSSSPLEQDYIYDQDESTMSYASVNEFPRPRGTMKLVSNVFLGFDDDFESTTSAEISTTRKGSNSPPTPDGAGGMKKLLKEFENELDASLSGIHDDDDASVDFGALTKFQDDTPRRVKSHEECQMLSVQQAKQMQRVLHQARKEVETLKDNNEQYLSEIEQTEEEHRSEMKLYTERTKQQISEMRAIYQAEIDSLVQEKDAAIAEAGREAARYAESGRKQIVNLKKQIEKLKTQAAEAVKKSAEEVAKKVTKKKDEEIMARLGALRKSYESELDKTRKGVELRVRTAVSEAVAKVTQKMLEDRDREVSESVRAARAQLDKEIAVAVQRATEGALSEAAHLRNENEAMLKALQSVKAKIDSRYSAEMEQLRERNKSQSNPMKLLQISNQNETASEKLFKEVVEAFAFLMENAEANVKSAEQVAEVERTKKERNEVYQQARIDLMKKHRSELDHARKQIEDMKDKIERLEQSLKTTSREKKALQEKNRKFTESHRNEIQRLQEKLEKAGRQVDGESPAKISAPTQNYRRVQEILSSTRTLNAMKPKTPSSSTSSNQVFPERDDSVCGDKQVECPPVRSFPSFPPPKVERTSSEARDDIERVRSTDTDSYDVRHSSTARRDSLGSPRISHLELNSQGQVSAIPSPSEVHRLSQAPPPPPPSPRRRVSEKESFNAHLATGSSRSGESTTLSTRDGDTSQFRNTKGPKPIEANHDDSQKDRKEPTGTKDCSPAERMKKKSFAILRSFKSARSSSPAANRDPVTSTQGKDPEGKSNSPSNSRSKHRRTGKIRYFLDSIGKGESSNHRRGSMTDESTSSLKADTGVTSPRQSQSCHAFRTARVSIEDSTSLDSHGDGSTADESSAHTRSSRRKKKNPLGMFTNRKRSSSKSPVKNLQHEQQTGNTNDDASSESHDQMPLLQGKVDDGLESSSFEVSETIASHQKAARPSLPGFNTNSGKQEPASPHVINGKKPPLPEWANFTDQIFTTGPAPTLSSPDVSTGESVTPETINLRNNFDINEKNGAEDTHAVCSHPMAARNKSSLQGFSCTSGDNIVFVGQSNGSTGRTSPTAASTDDDANFASQSQMRKFPPLGDASDEDSRDDSIDKYESCERPARFAKDYSPSPSNAQGKHIPLVVSRSVEDESPVIFMDSSNDSRPVVVQGHAIYRKPALSAFTPRRNLTDNREKTGSEATTAITAHTFRSSFNTEPSKLRDLQRSSLPSPTGRRARNSLAVIRARKSRRQTEG